MFAQVHVFIYLAACMCVVVLEGGRDTEKKQNILLFIWQHEMSHALALTDV